MFASIATSYLKNWKFITSFSFASFTFYNIGKTLEENIFLEDEKLTRKFKCDSIDCGGHRYNYDTYRRIITENPEIKSKFVVKYGIYDVFYDIMNSFVCALWTPITVPYYLWKEINKTYYNYKN